MSRKISKLPAKSAKKEINPKQGELFVDVQKEIQGIGMGVLSDGTPFLTQRGLASLCGVENAHIGTISSQWADEIPKPRISKIRDILSSRGLTFDSPHIEVKDGAKLLYAYSDAVCLAILEYYAFEAGSNIKEDARKNFRILAGQALQDFIYTQVGYDPNAVVADVWKSFHDRLSLTYDSVPAGYFGVFKEIADLILTLGQKGLHIDSSFVPDISVGMGWGKHWRSNELEKVYGARIEYEHNYPDDFPQAASNPQSPWCYPESALGEFRRWFRETYVGDGKLVNYLKGQAKKKALPATFAQLAIEAIQGEG